MKKLCIPLVLGWMWLGCKSPGGTQAQPPYASGGGIESRPAGQWDEMLLRNEGWIGADGVYAVALNGIETPGKAQETETLFWFSDNIWGRVQGDTLADGWEMSNNCVAYLKGGVPDGSKLQFFRRRNAKGETLSMFEPKTPATKPGDYYWLGDGYFNHALDSTIYIFAYRIKNIPGGIYPFDDVGLSLIALPKGSRPPFEQQRQLDVPFFYKDSGGRGKLVFGVSVLANTAGAGVPKPDGYIYIYGVRGPQKELVVARVGEKDFENFAAWRFWNGTEWTNDVHRAAALTSRVSNEMSVSFLEDGRVIAAYQLDTNSPDIMVQVGRTPAGPFQPAKKVWSTPQVYEDLDFYTYNAKAHPHLSRPGELLISYNVNSFDFLDDIKYKPHHLRPRFFTVKYK
ncbi:MAG TPA: DUF4185 domain-containing protein [Chitinophagaceae bacterium]|jgi:hypothetical protein|nr:DUF4185 domain-containing protein [Chitinophagaceae bacterium]